MPVEAGHVQVTEFTKESIPQINWMLEDLFCKYGISMPYFLLEFDFADYNERQNYLTWFNELLGLLFDEAGLPRWQMPDFSFPSIYMFNNYIFDLYDWTGWTEISRESGNNVIFRTGRSATSYDDAKTDYEDDPLYPIGEYTDYDGNLGWYNYRGTSGTPSEYQVIGSNTYLTFDTSGISSLTGAKLLFSGAEVQLFGVSEIPIIYIYEQDYGTLDSSDWTGGTKIAEAELSPGVPNFSVSIDTTYVTAGGTSRYRVALKKTVNTDYWDTPFPETGDYKGQLPLISTIKLSYK